MSAPGAKAPAKKGGKGPATSNGDVPVDSVARRGATSSLFRELDSGEDIDAEHETDDTAYLPFGSIPVHPSYPLPGPLSAPAPVFDPALPAAEDAAQRAAAAKASKRILNSLAREERSKRQRTDASEGSAEEEVLNWIAGAASSEPDEDAPESSKAADKRRKSRKGKAAAGPAGEGTNDDKFHISNMRSRSQADEHIPNNLVDDLSDEGLERLEQFVDHFWFYDEGNDKARMTNISSRVATIRKLCVILAHRCRMHVSFTAHTYDRDPNARQRKGDHFSFASQDLRRDAGESWDKVQELMSKAASDRAGGKKDQAPPA